MTEPKAAWTGEALRLLSLHEVARALGVHFYVVREMVESGELAALRVGRGGERQHWRVSPAALDAWHRRQGEVADMSLRP